jgi:nucleoside-diphosphate-sugar epimerase
LKKIFLVTGSAGFIGMHLSSSLLKNGFKVYGPWRRPDMVYHSFTEKILNDEQIEVYTFGKLQQYFTYIIDVIEST